MSDQAETDLPLSGTRILDLSRILAGPYCTMILGDLGAEVVKVERPGTGDDTRTWGPPFAGGESAYYLCCNRNKKSIAIDLQKPRGVELVKEFARVSDVLVENFTPGLMQRFGLDYETLRELNPRLVYCSITAYGQDGPYRDRPGYDMVLSAVGGLMWITGERDGEPCKVGVAITDVVTGVYASGAIMAALLWRERSGCGQYIDCSLLDVQVSALANIASNYLVAGKEAQRWGTAHESIVPYQVFRTKDRPIAIAVLQADRQAGMDRRPALRIQPQTCGKPRGALAAGRRGAGRQDVRRMGRAVRGGVDPLRPGQQHAEPFRRPTGSAPGHAGRGAAPDHRHTAPGGDSDPALRDAGHDSPAPAAAGRTHGRGTGQCAGLSTGENRSTAATGGDLAESHQLSVRSCQ